MSSLTEVLDPFNTGAWKPGDVDSKPKLVSGSHEAPRSRRSATPTLGSHVVCQGIWRPGDDLDKMPDNILYMVEKSQEANEANEELSRLQRLRPSTPLFRAISTSPIQPGRVSVSRAATPLDASAELLRTLPTPLPGAEWPGSHVNSVTQYSPPRTSPLTPRVFVKALSDKEMAFAILASKVTKRLGWEDLTPDCRIATPGGGITVPPPEFEIEKTPEQDRVIVEPWEISASEKDQQQELPRDRLIPFEIFESQLNRGGVTLEIRNNEVRTSHIFRRYLSQDKTSLWLLPRSAIEEGRLAVVGEPSLESPHQWVEVAGQRYDIISGRLHRKTSSNGSADWDLEDLPVEIFVDESDATLALILKPDDAKPLPFEEGLTPLFSPSHGTQGAMRSALALDNPLQLVRTEDGEKCIAVFDRRTEPCLIQEAIEGTIRYYFRPPDPFNDPSKPPDPSKPSDELPLEWQSLIHMTLYAALLGLEDGKFNPAEPNNSNILMVKRDASICVVNCDPKACLPMSNEFSQDPEKAGKGIAAVRFGLLGHTQCYGHNVPKDQRGFFRQELQHIVDRKSGLLKDIEKTLQDSVKDENERYARLQATRQRLSRMESWLKTAHGAFSLLQFWCHMFPECGRQWNSLFSRKCPPLKAAEMIGILPTSCWR